VREGSYADSYWERRGGWGTAETAVAVAESSLELLGAWPLPLMGVAIGIMVDWLDLGRDIMV